MFFKISINLLDKKFRELKLENLFENLSFNKVKKKWNVEIFTQDLIRDKFFISKLLGIKEVKVEKLKIKSLASYTKDSDFSVITKKFHISTFKKKTIKKNILIPASTAFGTGSHPSTFLAIRNLEKIFKKGELKKLSFLDVGTGTGILSFVIYKLSNKKINATDIDLESQRSFNRNAKLNSISNFRFYRCYGLNNHYLKKKKFTLIVSNILLTPLKKLAKDFTNHLVSGGVIIVSGILYSQKNDIVNYYSKFNLKLVKSTYIEGWVSLIFKKYAIY
jgi:ribosomal protein L11 methyltransferase